MMQRGIPAIESNPTPKRSKARVFLGVLAGVMMVGAATTAVAAPMMDPGPLAPVARLINVEATKAARGAYVEAQLQNGYVLTPTVQLAQ
jgi:hypothetical protein